jgi:hypothetical protein
MDPFLRGCIMIYDTVLRGIIIRAKAQAYIDNSLIINSLILFTCFLDHVVQGFNPAKAECDTISFAGMTERRQPLLKFHFPVYFQMVITFELDS